MCWLQQNDRSKQDELKSKDHIMNKLLTTMRHLTSSELKLKDNIIHISIIIIIIIIIITIKYYTLIN